MADWFAPKRYGIGSGMPIAPAGWAILALYLAVVIGAATLFGRHSLAAVAVIVPATIVLIFVCANNTRGGWRWRWGERD